MTEINFFADKPTILVHPIATLQPGPSDLVRQLGSQLQPTFPMGIERVAFTASVSTTPTHPSM